MRSRAYFDAVAATYDRARPGYPVALFDDLTPLAGVGPGCRVLEIGCGTGQATVPLAVRGCRVTAVELGPNLAALARRNLAAALESAPEGGSARIEVADFERWMPPEQRFDVVLAATAWHWLDPLTRFDRVADALRPGGALATITTYHIAGGTERFFADVQPTYRRFDPSTPPDVRLPPASRIPVDRDLGHSTRFGRPQFCRYEWEESYATAQYLDLLRTYSSTLALGPVAREGLLHAIGTLIEGRYHGRISKRYLTELRLARCVTP
ncbi:MAG TPA: class I SAM-dependent methyltransferase [Pseudonocardiaceae bacterium]|nr:class I SAM-dependent methyltransferase [Pseudonocardiaceae bacterium]